MKNDISLKNIFQKRKIPLYIIYVAWWGPNLETLADIDPLVLSIIIILPFIFIVLFSQISYAATIHVGYGVVCGILKLSEIEQYGSIATGYMGVVVGAMFPSLLFGIFLLIYALIFDKNKICPATLLAILIGSFVLPLIWADHNGICITC